MNNTNALTIEQANHESQNILTGYLDIVYTKFNDDYAEATMPVSEKVSQIFGILHGGATITLAESVAGLGTLSIVYPEYRCVGMQISASHISSAKLGDTVIAKAHIIHKGRLTHIWNVDVYSENTKKLISSVRVTNAIIKNDLQPL